MLSLLQKHNPIHDNTYDFCIRAAESVPDVLSVTETWSRREVVDVELAIAWFRLSGKVVVLS